MFCRRNTSNFYHPDVVHDLTTFTRRTSRHSPETLTAVNVFSVCSFVTSHVAKVTVLKFFPQKEFTLFVQFSNVQQLISLRVLRRIFGPKMDEVTGEWRKLHNEELNDLYSSPTVVRVIKSRRIWWAYGGG
jgi:hypothetical protein